jgi:hypothetical protein
LVWWIAVSRLGRGWSDASVGRMRGLRNNSRVDGYWVRRDTPMQGDLMTLGRQQDNCLETRRMANAQLPHLRPPSIRSFRLVHTTHVVWLHAPLNISKPVSMLIHQRKHASGRLTSSTPARIPLRTSLPPASQNAKKSKVTAEKEAAVAKDWEEGGESLHPTMG